MAITVKYFSGPAATWVTSTAYVVGDLVVGDGTNGENWRCISNHTSSAGDRPVSGGSYLTYWERCDATSWAKRGRLFNPAPTPDVWNPDITGFNFAGSDSLLCYIGGTLDTITVALASGLFANAPTVANQLFFHGCDSSGNPLTPPDPDWKSCEPAWSTTGLPVLATTSNVSTSSCANVSWRLMAFTASNLSAAILTGGDLFDWLSLTNSSSNTSARCITAGRLVTNCVATCTGTSYDHVVNTSYQIENCRIVGRSDASSGDRDGIEGSNAGSLMQRCTVINNPGLGCQFTSSSTSQNQQIIGCVIANNGGKGIEFPSTASQTLVSHIDRCMITGNGGLGIDPQTNSRVLVTNTRLRDNTGGNFGNNGNYPVTGRGIYETDSDDATEYVNAAGGDFTLKAGTTAATLGVGVATQGSGGVKYRGGLGGNL